MVKHLPPAAEYAAALRGLADKIDASEILEIDIGIEAVLTEGPNDGLWRTKLDTGDRILTVRFRPA